MGELRCAAADLVFRRAKLLRKFIDGCFLARMPSAFSRHQPRITPGGPKRSTRTESGTSVIRRLSARLVGKCIASGNMTFVTMYSSASLFAYAERLERIQTLVVATPGKAKGPTLHPLKSSRGHPHDPPGPTTKIKKTPRLRVLCAIPSTPSRNLRALVVAVRPPAFFVFLRPFAVREAVARWQEPHFRVQSSQYGEDSSG